MSEFKTGDKIRLKDGFIMGSFDRSIVWTISDLFKSKISNDVFLTLKTEGFLIKSTSEKFEFAE